MGSRKRQSTKYPGVFFREAKRIGGVGTEKVFYVVFKKDGKTCEQKVGRQFKDNMTPAKAANLRGQLIEGKQKTRKEIKIQKSQKKWTISELWNEYVKSREPNRSFRTDELRYQAYLHNTVGSKRPKEILSLDVERIKLQMQKQGRAPQTQKHALALLKRIANFGSQRGLCEGIPFKMVMPKVDNKTTEDLSPDELARLLEAIEADSNKAVGNIMKLALFTGMRKGEIFKLQWTDINFHRGFILIRHPKGGVSQEIPLNSEADKLLRDWPKIKGSPYVFPGKDGKQRATISVAANRIKKAAGLPEGFRPLHGLRHVFASILASSGQVDMYTLQKLLTHKSPVMTQRYAHLRDEALKRAANLAGTILAEARNESRETGQSSLTEVRNINE